MKKICTSIFCAAIFAVFSSAFGDTIKLNAPDLERGDKVMKAFSKRKSTRTFVDRELSIKDLSDLLWAANGINRPDSDKRTAPSAHNRQDIKIYVCMKSGAYLYNAKAQSLELISKDDMRQTRAPATLVLVSDQNDRWSGLDAGIVSQNISIFCAGTGLATYTHTTMDASALKKGLKLKGAQTPMVCNSVGYEK